MSLGKQQEADLDQASRPSSLRSQQTGQRDLGNLFGYLVGCQPALRAVPAREPEDHAEQAERRGDHVQIPQFPALLELAERFPDQINICALPLINLTTLSDSQPGDLVHYDRNRIVPLRGAAAG